MDCEHDFDSQNRSYGLAARSASFCFPVAEAILLEIPISGRTLVVIRR